MTMRPKILAPSLLLLLVPAAQANLLTNGDFESGNSGFTSDYFYAPGGNTTEGQYTVRTDPQNWNGAYYAMPDHTTGTGNLLVVNGATSGTPTVWTETIGVTPNTLCDFSGFVSTAVSGGPADLVVLVNGVQLGGSTTAPADPMTWLGFSRIFATGTATSAKVEIVDLNTNRYPNDFYLDDLSLNAVPEPAPFAAVGLSAVAMLRRRR